MNIAIVGSRNYPDLGQVAEYVAKIARKYPDAIIVSGGARGVDRAAEQAALNCGLEFISYRPAQTYGGFAIEVYYSADSLLTPHTVLGKHYRTYGQAAYGRNGDIVAKADNVVAFTTGSKGTANSIGLARELGKPVFVYSPRVGSVS